MSGNASRPPLQGYNHNIRYGSRVYHVQTEDSGIDHPHLFTHLFFNGVIIATAKTDYSELASQQAHEPKVRKLMQTQHKKLMKQLRSGHFDEKITAMLGVDEILEARRTGGEPAEATPTETESTSPSVPVEPAAHPVPPTAPDAPAPPSIAELAAAAGISTAAAARPKERSTTATRAKAGSHPVATWMDPTELEEPGGHTLRMVVGEALEDDEDTLVQARAAAAETNPYRPGNRAQPNETSPVTPAPPAQPRKADQADPPRPAPPVPSTTSRDVPRGPVSTPQRYVAPGQRAGGSVPAARPARPTGRYGGSPPSVAGRRPRTPDRHDSGVYQITIGGARPVAESVRRAETAPRVLARPAVIVDRVPGNPASPLQQAISGVPPQRPGAKPGRAPAGVSRKRTLPSIFGADLISERSLDEVILQYLSEDQE